MWEMKYVHPRMFIYHSAFSLVVHEYSQVYRYLHGSHGHRVVSVKILPPWYLLIYRFWSNGDLNNSPPFWNWRGNTWTAWKTLQLTMMCNNYNYCITSPGVNIGNDKTFICLSLFVCYRILHAYMGHPIQMLDIGPAKLFPVLEAIYVRHSRVGIHILLTQMSICIQQLLI